ncbi:MAG: hypothetical protein ACREMU_10300, partial [Gemmatimonadaceae bacterium]
IAGGPDPRAQPAGRIVAPPREQPPVLTTFTINGGAASAVARDTAIALSHTVVGARPTEYRASRRADFVGAPWLPYVATPTVRDWYDASGEPCDAARPSHRVTYFLQVRAALGEELKTADGQRRMVPSHVESNVLRASICAYTGTGAPDDLPSASLSALTQAILDRKSMARR